MVDLVDVRRYSCERTHLLCLIIAAALVYGTASFAFHHTDNPLSMDADEQEYYGLASALLNHSYMFDPQRPPIHVLILYILRVFTFDHLLATRVLVSLIFSLTGPLMYLLARRMTGHIFFALTVGVATILWPPFIFYGSTLYSETTALPLFVLVLLSMPFGSVFVCSARLGWGRSGVAGALLGLCILVRPMYVLFPPFAVLILFLEEQSRAVATKRAASLAAGCLLVVLPWSTYISLKTGVPILISANGGQTLGGGLNPVLLERGYQTSVAPDGRQTWVGPGKWIDQWSSSYLRNKSEQELPSAQRDALLRQRAINWIRQNPGSALRLEGAKLLYMWGFYPFWNGTRQTLFGNVPTVIMLVLSVLSLGRLSGSFRRMARAWTLPLFVSMVALISWGSWRFRQPGDLGLIMLSGLFVWSLFVNPKRVTAPDVAVLKG